MGRLAAPHVRLARSVTSCPHQSGRSLTRLQHLNPALPAASAKLRPGEMHARSGNSGASSFSSRIDDGNEARKALLKPATDGADRACRRDQVEKWRRKQP